MIDTSDGGAATAMATYTGTFSLKISPVAPAFVVFNLGDPAPYGGARFQPASRS